MKIMEQFAIGLLFLGAVSYAGNRLWQAFLPKKTGCAKGCGCDLPIP